MHKIGSVAFKFWIWWTLNSFPPNVFFQTRTIGGWGVIWPYVGMVKKNSDFLYTTLEKIYKMD